MGLGYEVIDPEAGDVFEVLPLVGFAGDVLVGRVVPLGGHLDRRLERLLDVGLDALLGDVAEVAGLAVELVVDVGAEVPHAAELLADQV